MIHLTSVCTIPRPQVLSRGRGYSFPLIADWCQVPGGRGSSCPGCTYGVADMGNVLQIIRK
nr:MAG TPA: hypothetical protein [Inoviridae sp.]